MACDFCKRFDFSTAKIEVDKHNARILLALCNTKFDAEEQFKYCPKCGEKIDKINNYLREFDWMLYKLETEGKTLDESYCIAVDEMINRYGKDSEIVKMLTYKIEK